MNKELAFFIFKEGFKEGSETSVNYDNYEIRNIFEKYYSKFESTEKLIRAFESCPDDIKKEVLEYAEFLQSRRGK